MGKVENWRAWNLPKIDLLIGGSPCQGFSRNGKGLNFDDTRSKLFFAYVEILEHLKKQNPNIKFLLENVEMKKEWEDVISGALCVKPIKINSNLVSAQNRPRLYWVNFKVEEIKDKNIRLKDVCNRVQDAENLSMSEKKLIINIDGHLAIKQATKAGYIIPDPYDGINLQMPTSKTRRGRVIRQKSPTLDCQCNVCVYDGTKVRKITIEEAEKLQTLPPGYTSGFSERIRKKAIGNGWTVDVIAHIFSGLVE